MKDLFMGLFIVFGNENYREKKGEDIMRYKPVYVIFKREVIPAVRSWKGLIFLGGKDGI